MAGSTRRTKKRKAQTRKPVMRKRPPTPPKKRKKKKSKSSLFIKIILSSLILLCCVVFIGSLLLRKEVKYLLAKQETISSSAIYSRAIPVQVGSNISEINVIKALEGISYRRVGKTPSQPGQYFLDSTRLDIFSKKKRISSTQITESELVKIQLNNGVVSSIRKASSQKPANVYWLEPQLLSSLGDSSQRVSRRKSFEQFSILLRQAILATEDQYFYAHFGIDPVSILRAMYANAMAGKVIQGGSTLTQQLAKNLFFTSKRTLSRKIKEAVAAVMIEAAYSKDKIFEMYLNQVFLGQEGKFGIYGFGEASQTFFRKDVSQLNLAEASLLAGLVKAPSSYAPRRYFKRAKKRQAVVLARMLDAGYINESEKRIALDTELKIFPAVRNRRAAPYFAEYIKQQVGDLLSESAIEEGALNIITTLDNRYQSCAEKSLNQGLKKLEKRYPRLTRKKEPLQAALVSLEPSTGAVRAWVGGRDFSESQFDRVYSAKRQPGSTFKPFVYLTALDSSLNSYRTAKTTSILMDEPVEIELQNGNIWTPKNYNKKFHGEVRLRNALARSLNLATVNLSQKVGIEAIARTASLFGFGDDLPIVPSLALGAGEVSPLELAQAYAILANGGIKRSIVPFTLIEDSRGNEVIFEQHISEKRIVNEGPIFVLTDILRTAIDSGTGNIVRRLGYQLAAAGKTGTTNDARDAWFAGYTPHHLAIVWVGYDSNKSHGLTGSSGAAPIWAEYMKCVSRFEPVLDFLPPPSVIFRKLDSESGLLHSSNCPQSSSVTEVFVSGTEPITLCPIHSWEGKVDRVKGWFD